jgi:tetratricopeptide (TPR) repeat protein
VAVKSHHRPSIAARALKFTLLGLGFVFLGITSYMALMTALVPEADRVPRLDAEALRRMSPGEVSDAQAAAQAAFARNPLDARSLSELSRIAAVQGDEDAATRLMLIAGDMQPRALGIQAEALNMLLQRRDFRGAMTALDGLIRARPNKARELFAVAADIASDPEGRNAVATSLAARPPWRQSFLARTLAAGKPEIVAQIFSELRVLGTPASTAELALLISHYLKGGEIDAAYTIWLASLDPEELQRVKLVYDGGFDQAIRNLRFDWTIEPAKGLSYRLFPRNTASLDMTLQIDFQDFDGDIANLSQILRLRPGRYRLRGEVRFEDFQSPSGVAFRLHCLDGGQLRPLDESGPLPQSSQWIAFEKTFSVPASGCPDQLLRLESQDGGEATGRTAGQVAFDNITIDNLPALAP